MSSEHQSVPRDAAQQTVPGDVSGTAVPTGTPQGRAVGVGFQTSLALAFFGTYLALLPLAQVTLALKIGQIDPEGRAGSLSLVLGVGSFVALVAQNVFGALSDRTTSRFGMRRPWLAAGAVLGAGSLFLLSGASTIPVVLAGWSLIQLTFNVLLAALNPVLPDQVPRRQLGRVSGLIGLTQSVAAVGGVFLAKLFLPDLTKAILIPGIFTLACVGLLLVVLKDRTRARADVPPFQLSLFLKAFWTDPRKAPDFALAWWSRLFVFFGNMTLSGYAVFFLQDRFGFDQSTIGDAILRTTLVTTVCVVLTSLLVGRFSDRIGRRKVFVMISALVLALAHVMAALSPTFDVYVLATAVAGLAQGTYIAVDAALLAEVLPSRADVGKDMGVLHLANVLPQTLVPVVAPLFLAIGTGGENYTALFIGGAVVGIVGAVLNQFIKSIR
ncbi:MFS transporter [Kineococcus sp. LSe6-4]|uniref:MFS transporter n=1 Tax=Kineococcus halophytocola TaxID=3234027 RepID=A0ABV4H5X2_9ACTN